MKTGEKDERSRRHTIVNKAQSQTQHLALSHALITALKRLLLLPAFSLSCYHLLIKPLQSVRQIRSAKLITSQLFCDNNLSMLCHTERRQILFSGFATRETRSPSSVSDADICRSRRELCDNSSHAGAQQWRRSSSSRVVFKKGQKHFLKQAELSFGFLSVRNKANKTHGPGAFASHTYTSSHCQQDQITPEKTVINNTIWLVKKATSFIKYTQRTTERLSWDTAGVSGLNANISMLICYLFFTMFNILVQP